MGTFDWFAIGMVIALVSVGVELDVATPALRRLARAAGAIACARKAVSDGVIAVFGYTNFPQQVLPIYEAGHVAWLGGLFTAFSNTSPVAYQTTPGGFLAWGPDYLAAKECKRVVTMATDIGVPVTPEATAWTNSAWKAAGNSTGGPVASILIPFTTTDVTPFLVKAEQANPDCLSISLGANLEAGLVAALSSQGALTKYKIYTEEPGSLTSDFTAKYPQQTEGWKTETLYELPSVNKAWAEYDNVQKAANNLGKYAVRVDDSTERQVWVGWKIFTDAMKNSSAADITAPKLVDALSKDCSVDTGGLLPTMNFCEKLPYTNIERLYDQWMAPGIVHNGKITAYQGGKYVNFVDIWKKGGAVPFPAR